MPKKVVFCWSDISGYMAACWRALVQSPDLQVFVIAFQAKTETAFSDQLMAGIPCRLLDLAERQNAVLIHDLVFQHQPDVLVIPGWLHPPYRQLVAAPKLRSVPIVMGMDTPWRSTVKQRLAPYALRPLLRRINQVVVTGDRSWQYAARLGVPRHRIERGLYGVDAATLAPLWGQRQAEWPRQFLFVGRYIAAKGLDTLVSAYQRYHQQSARPWPLLCCGQGPLASALQNQPGITDGGFVQPQTLLAHLRQAGALVLPSRFDPWPLALVEGATAGLPIICTDACGSAVEVIRSGYNGYVVPPEDVISLAKALQDIEQAYPQLPTWGQRSQALAHPYAAHLWAERWSKLLQAVAA
jgi:glycosyltransferase involved in cell wall biosynthesis